MASAVLRSDEKAGLGVAILLHAALVALLLLQPSPGDPPAVPERMTVSFAEDVGLTAQAPDPVSESRAAIAPILSDDPAPAPLVEQPEPIAQSAPPSRASRAPARREPTSRAPRRRPDRQESRPAAQPTRSGGSRMGDNFLPGSGASTTTEETRIPASQIGASAKASITQAIIRQIRPHWTAPNGVDAEQLVSVLAFNLNEDGSLAGRPRVLNQSGITPSNRPQASLHAERAVRAVQLAAPFDLPPEYYNAWKSIRGARFDRNLSR